MAETQEVRTGNGIAGAGKALAQAGKNLYSDGAMNFTGKSDKIILIIGVVLLAALVFKSLKQMIFLSFTLLSLKIVWVIIVVLFLLTYVK
ncbi:MAG TPA: hypothetical protein VF888_02685, partial [Nitrospirota bacterium]